jgi:hypothetical protein
MRSALLGLVVLLPGSPQDAAMLLKRDGWKAVRELVRGGGRGLEEASRSADPDVAFYARAARAEWELHAGEDLRIAPPTRAFEGPAVDAAAELFRSAGLSFEPGGLPARRVSLPDGLSVAEAVERLSRDLDVEFLPRPEGAWTAEPGFRKLPRFASGRVLAAVTECRAWSGRELGRGTTRSLAFSGELRLLGRLSRPVLYGDLRILEAVDDRGADLRVEGGAGGFHPTEEHGACLAGVEGSLKPLSPGASRVARLRLAGDLALAGRREDISFPLGAETLNVKKGAGDVTAVLRRTFWEDAEYRVEIEVRARSLVRRFREEDLRLLDPDGKPWTLGGKSGSSGNDAVAWDVRFRNPGALGAPTRLVCSVVAEASIRTVYFEIPGLEPP